ncbi:MAG: TonB-dependent receptor [Ferrimonas sp.]
MSIQQRLSLSLCALAVTNGLCVSVWASDFEHGADIETLVITGTRFSQATEQSLNHITIITRDEIERLAPQSVAELLQQVPAVQITQTGGAGQLTTISLRGANASHSLIVLDGVRVGAATNGSADLSSIAPHMIERIEISQGARAAIWGSDAIGGVIQIFTRQLHVGEWALSMEGGSNGYARLSSAAGLSHGAGSSTLSVNGERSDGFNVKQGLEPDADGFERLNLGLRGQQEISDALQLSWVGQYNQGQYDFDQDGSDANWQPYDDGQQHTEYQNYHYQLGAHINHCLLQSRLTASQMQEQATNFLNRQRTSRYTTTRNQASALSQLELTQGYLGGGLDWSQEHVSGNDYRLDQRTLVGGFLTSHWQWQQWQTEASVRHDQVRGVDNETTYHLGLGYTLAALQLSVSHGTAFKVPTFNDLYWPDSGNPDLRSETSKTTEISGHLQQPHWQMRLRGYQTEVTDLIQWAPDPESNDGSWRPFNVAQATLKGIESAFSWQHQGWQTQLNYSYLDAKDDQDTRLMNRSYHTANGQLVYAWSQADLGLSYHYRGTTTTNDAYGLLGLSWGYHFQSGWQLRVAGKNLLDKEAINNRGYYGAGRELYLGISYANF